MAKDAEVASLFQPYRCRVTALLGSHLGQVAGAMIEAYHGFDHRVGHFRPPGMVDEFPNLRVCRD